MSCLGYQTTNRTEEEIEILAGCEVCETRRVMAILKVLTLALQNQVFPRFKIQEIKFTCQRPES